MQQKNQNSSSSMSILNWWSSSQEEPRTQRQQRGQRVGFCVTSRATYWAKSFPPLCCHLDSIGFSRAGKSNASFKTNCFLSDQLFLSLMCNSFTPSWTHTQHTVDAQHTISEGVMLSFLSPATQDAAERRRVGCGYRAKWVWLRNHVCHTLTLRWLICWTNTQFKRGTV